MTSLLEIAIKLTSSSLNLLANSTIVLFTCLTYGQWLQINILTEPFFPLRSFKFLYSSLITSNNEKSGALVPKLTIFEVVLAIFFKKYLVVILQKIILWNNTK